MGGPAKGIGDDELKSLGRIKGKAKGLGAGRGGEGGVTEAPIGTDAVAIDHIRCFLGDKQGITTEVGPDLGWSGIGSAQGLGGTGDGVQRAIAGDLEPGHVGGVTTIASVDDIQAAAGRGETDGIDPTGTRHAGGSELAVGADSHHKSHQRRKVMAVSAVSSRSWRSLA